MRAFLFIASTLALVLAASAVPSYNNYPHIDNFDEAGECVPNKSFYNKCNHCRCTADGKSADCTMMACPEDETLRIDNYVEGQKCPAGKSFLDRCNTCKCASNGLSAACTRMACPDVPTPRTRRSAENNAPHIDNFNEAGECVPGKSFYNQCNLCHCAPDGKSAICTMKACLEPSTISIDDYVEGQKCPAGKSFLDRCNTCKCASNGLSATCTRMACPDAPASRTRRSAVSKIPHIDNFDEAGQCVPNKSFYNKCNRCRCTADGKSADCTMMACPDYETLRIDNYVEGQKCPAGKAFLDKCNFCKCTDDGFSAACTRMACPGYDNEAASRTRRSVETKIPHNDNFDESGECEANKRFFNKCNLCRCSSDGKSAVCSQKACESPKTIRIDNYVQGKKCPAGKNFVDKCNFCSCNNDGVSAFCTLALCSDDA